VCGPNTGDAELKNCSGARDFDETLGVCVVDGASASCSDFDGDNPTSPTSPTSVTAPTAGGLQEEAAMTAAAAPPVYISGCVSSGVLPFWCMMPSNYEKSFGTCGTTCATYLTCGATFAQFSKEECPGDQDFDENSGTCVADGSSPSCIDN